MENVHINMSSEVHPSLLLSVYLSQLVSVNCGLPMLMRRQEAKNYGTKVCVCGGGVCVGVGVRVCMCVGGGCVHMCVCAHLWGRDIV